MTSKETPAPGRAHLYTTSKSEKDNGLFKPQRQQFTACGICRYRRVKCDLKDVAAANPNATNIQCTNCKDRGSNCVDTYKEAKEAKAPKQLRRGKRLKEAESLYGKNPQAQPPRSDPGPSNSLQSPNISSSSPSGSLIPPLTLQFFQSPFFRRFHIQRPILDHAEFTSRFLKAQQGDAKALGPLGELIAKVLVIWAASYGVDERGIELPPDGIEGVKMRRKKCKEMVKELLALIDAYAILRKPSWDGVRVLLLTIPLTEDVLEPVERLAIYQNAITHIFTLCSTQAPVNSGQGDVADTRVRARIFWYGHVHEGITSGLRGRKLIFDEDDVSIFEKDIKATPEMHSRALVKSPITLSYMLQYATAPTRVSAACRQINAALTGPKAQLRETVNEPKLKLAWESLEKCWLEFDELRTLRLEGIITQEDMERFVSGWKIFIFECHNVIRETLKKKKIEQTPRARAYVTEVDERPATANRHTPYEHTSKLLAIAEAKCLDRAREVMVLIKQQLNSESFFDYDASLVRDGTFYAGDFAEREEDVDACIDALCRMRWAFCQNESRIAALKFSWDNKRRGGEEGRMAIYPPPPGAPLSREPRFVPTDATQVEFGYVFDSDSPPQDFLYSGPYDEQSYNTTPSSGSSGRPLEPMGSLSVSPQSQNSSANRPPVIDLSTLPAFPTDFSNLSQSPELLTPYLTEVPNPHIVNGDSSYIPNSYVQTQAPLPAQGQYIQHSNDYGDYSSYNDWGDPNPYASSSAFVTDQSSHHNALLYNPSQSQSNHYHNTTETYQQPQPYGADLPPSLNTPLTPQNIAAFFTPKPRDGAHPRSHYPNWHPGSDQSRRS